MIITEHPPARPGQFVLHTDEADELAAFYTGLFGWQPTTDGAFQARGQTVARLAAPVTGAATGWLPYLTVADVDVTLAEATAAGAAPVRQPGDGAGGRTAVVTAPAGAALGLWQQGSGAGVGVMDEPDAVVWVEEKTHDQAVDTAFLSKVFGYEVVGPEGPGKVRVLSGTGTLFGGVMQFDDRWAADEAPHWLLYFQTDDVEATAARATERGGSVWFPPFDTPLGQMAYLRDPRGHPFAVVTTSEQGRAMTGGGAT